MNYYKIILHFSTSVESFIFEIKNQEPKKNFTPPIVFLDEITTITEDRIKLLRNLCRVLGLPTVLASTSAKIMNLLNLNSASAIKSDSIWVYAIRTLPPVNLKGIFHLLTWNEYIELNGDLNLKMILDGLNIRYEDTEFSQLQNLVWLMIKQSKTCLQGVALIFFKAFKEGLEAQSGYQLDVKIIWKQGLISLQTELHNRKPHAFIDIGPLHTLAMMTNHQIIVNSEETMIESEIIFETINHHYYFFGCTTDENVIPFQYDGVNLILNGKYYNLCSHFKLFHENLFFCLAMWLDVGKKFIDDQNGRRISVASVFAEYAQKLRAVSKNIFALKNDSSAQECVIHWGLCNSTSKGFSNLNPGFSFMSHFIKNIQIGKKTFSNLMMKVNNKPTDEIEGFDGVIDFDSCSNLEAFLSKIQIPQLLPREIVTGEIRDKLKGLCTFGECNRLSDPAGIDVEFDLFFNGHPRKGFVECKYIDKNIEKSTVLDYIIKTCKRNSPFSMIVTYSMQKCLKSAKLWRSEKEMNLCEFDDEKSNEYQYLPSKMLKSEISGAKHETNEEREQVELEIFRRKILEKKMEKFEEIKLKEKLVEGVSIYSVHYKKDGLGMVAVPLVEYENPKGVFIIIQTNFISTKI